MAAEQDGGVGGDVGLEEIGGVKLAEDLDDFRLRGGFVVELSADQVPRLADRAAERPSLTVGRRSYARSWLCLAGWCLLVALAVYLVVEINAGGQRLYGHDVVPPSRVTIRRPAD